MIKVKKGGWENKNTITILIIVFSFLFNVLCEARRIKGDSQHLILHAVYKKNPEIRGINHYSVWEIDVRAWRGNLYIMHDEGKPSSDTQLLSEFLTAYPGVIFQLDIKIEASGHTEVEPIGLLNSLGEENRKRVIVSSRDLKFLREMRKLDVGIKLGYDPSQLLASWNRAEVFTITDDMKKIVDELNLSFLFLPENIAYLLIEKGIAREFVEELKSKECTVVVWTINDEQQIRKLLSYGFWVTTDLGDL